MRIDDIAKFVKEISKGEIEDILSWAIAKDFCPFCFEWDEIRITFKPLSYRHVIFFQQMEYLRERSIACSYLPLRVRLREHFFSLIANGIGSIEYKEAPVSDIDLFIRKLHGNMLFVVTKLIFILNGLDPIVEKPLTAQLKQLEDIAYAFFANLLKNEGVPVWASPFIISFQVFRECGKWSAPTPIDEPYLLWLAWLAIARGENRYYDEKQQATTSQTLPIGAVKEGERQLPSASAIETLRQSFDVDELVRILSGD